MALGKTQPEFIEDPEIATGIEKSLNTLNILVNSIDSDTNIYVNLYFKAALREALSVLDNDLIEIPTHLLTTLTQIETTLDFKNTNAKLYINKILERHKKMY